MIRKRYWLVALILAIAIHWSALAVVTGKQDDGTELPGKQGIEIDLGMLGEPEKSEEPKQLEPVEVPAEPEVEESEPEPVSEPVIEPEPVKQLEPVKPKQQTEIKVKATPKPVIKPQLKPEAIVESEPEPELKAEAVVKTEVRRSAKNATAHTAQQKQNTGSANAISNGVQAAVRQSYFNLLAAKLTKHKRYPSASRRRGEEGIVKLFFVIDRHGKVLDYRITESSGSKRLDEAVILMLKKAEPLPAFPDDMIQPQLEVNVPIAFQLDQ